MISGILFPLLISNIFLFFLLLPNWVVFLCKAVSTGASLWCTCFCRRYALLIFDPRPSQFRHKYHHLLHLLLHIRLSFYSPTGIPACLPAGNLYQKFSPVRTGYPLNYGTKNWIAKVIISGYRFTK
jgi:hypothetical protein